MPEALRKFKSEIFQALAHPNRIAIVEILRDGELSVGSIIDIVGLEQVNASQHLAVLRARNIITCRKEGTQVFYSIRDPLLYEMLDVMRLYFHRHVENAMSMLREMSEQETVVTS